MEGWVCPECGRTFGRANQGHACQPAMALEDYFSTGPPHERPIFEAVMAHLAEVGPVHVEPVSVGIFLKNPRKFAELRPMLHWTAVSFDADHTPRHRTIVRKVLPHGGRFFVVANVTSPDDLDEPLLDLLAAAYRHAADRR